MFMADFCFFCYQNVVGVKGKNPLDRMNNHFKERHPGTSGCNQIAHSEYDKRLNELEKRNVEIEKNILEIQKNGFRPVKTNRSRITKRKLHCKKYKCLHCDINFSTSVTAMRLHCDSHKRGEMIKIAKTKSGLYRPEEHVFNTTTNKRFHGSDAHLCKILIPLEFYSGDETLVCRKCDKFRIDFPKNLNLRRQSARVDKIRMHEYNCK